MNPAQFPAKLTNRLATTARDQAQASVMETQQSLVLSQAGSRREEIAAARAQVLAARGALQTVQAELNDTQIVAPFDAIVIENMPMWVLLLAP